MILVKAPLRLIVLFKQVVNFKVRNNDDDYNNKNIYVH